MIQYISWDQMIEAYKDCIKHKKSAESYQKFDIISLKNLYQLWIELNQEKYVISDSIAFVVHKPSDREVFAADFRDRIVHHLIILYLDKFFEQFFIHDAYQCRKGKGTLCAVQSLQQQLKLASNNFKNTVYILQGDLKNFFCSINKNILFSLIQKALNAFKIKNFDFYLKLIHQIIFDKPQLHCKRKQDISHWKNLPFEKSLFNLDTLLGLPVGNLTSQKFAAIFLTYFDRFVLEHFLYYGRYVDDFFIIDENKEKLKHFIEIMNTWLQDNLKLQLQFKKIKIKNSNSSIKFVGTVIKQNRTFIIKRTIRNFKMKMNMFYNFYAKNNYLTVKNCKYILSIANCYIGMLLHTNSYRKRKQLMLSSKIFWTNMFMFPSKNYKKFELLSDFKTK